jgi:AraC-like DNA-binding protein
LQRSRGASGIGTSISTLSRHYVQRLLEETGQSFTERLAERRLDRAFAMLTDPRRLHLAITDIARAAGFGDVSHFNRVFRRRFRDTPSGAGGGDHAEAEMFPPLRQRAALVPTSVRAL